MYTFFMDKVIPVMNRVGNNKYLVAIRDGLSITIPFTIIGSVFLIIANLPINGWADILGDFAPKLNAAVNVTFGAIGLIASVSLGYFFSKMHKIEPITGTIMSLVTFLLATLDKNLSVNISAFGSAGLFVAIIIAMITTGIMAWFVKKGILIELPDGVPPAVGKSFEALLPAAASILVIWVVRVLLNFDINSFITFIFTPFVVALNTLPGALLLMLLILLLWFVGIHGNTLVGNLALPVTMTYLTANTEAMQHGHVPTYINAEGFYYFGMGLGGTGATIGLALVIALFAKSKRYKTLGKLTLTPALFSINEPLIFGFPIVLNPVMLVPFVGTPILLQVITWFLMKYNLIGKVVTSIPWTTPPVLSGFLVTGGDWRAAVWQAIGILVSVAIYLPFFKALDNQELKNELTKEV
ncbi:MAG: PTS transporter subunit EIIC [Lactococcus plantarum]|nr:PTS transporter subunit EIIC [Lactococcus plantarum]MDN6070708.1 PTS transporter subunit EIIC [Lactococcus plantarum]MDN6084021.1 PTS transporter subunit EIIC [Lactococcus plantarum]